MATTLQLYNTTVKRLVAQEVDLAALKLMLLDSTAVFDPANTTLNQVAGAGHTKEVSGNGWSVGGPTLANVAVTVVTTNDAMLDADDVAVTASGGAIGPARRAVLYDDSDASDAPLGFLDFGSDESAQDGNVFRINWPVTGIIAFNLPG